METLEYHQQSLADHFKHIFRELTKTIQQYEHDKKVHERQIQELEFSLRLEKMERKDDTTQIRDLKSTIAQKEGIERENRALKAQRTEDALRIEKLLKGSSTPSTAKKDENEAEENDALEQKLRLLEQSYEPGKVAHDTRKETDGLAHTETMYRRLYNETVTLVRASRSLRSQVKHYKERAAQWQRWSSDSVAKSITNTAPKAHADQDQENDLGTPLAAALPPVRATSAVYCAANANSDPDSTEPNTMSPTASASSLHEGGNVGDQGTIRVKDEPLSPGSLQQASSEGMQSGCQDLDLDEVGDVVTTPRSRKFAVFEDETSGLQLDETNTRNQYTGRSAFQPKDTNQWSKPREPSSKRRRTGDSGASAISSVSEDGDEAYTRSARRTRQEIETPCKGSTRNPEAHQRLDDLLSARPQRHSAALDPSLRTPGLAPGSTPGSTPGPTPGSKAKKTIADWMKPRLPNMANTEVNGEDWNAIIKSVPYRERPVDCLDLSCFKPNPAKNHGLDYAYKEVVRDREQRKCLPGCMRGDCCGEKFRALARAGGAKYEDKDRALLEEYLGDQAHTLDTMADSRRDDLFVEAKARQLANRFGKHRHAYERARSPPGFWRTEMPSTQELARDRVEADRMEREKVLDRVREALRADGLWVFADESV
jgi:DNA repair protein endonuclease SAE2/CtIP C-terminus